MQYLLLIYGNEKRFANGYDQAEMGEYQAFGKEFAKSIKGGNALKATKTAKTVRVQNGKAVMTDGPFAETKEQLAGYYILDCADLDEALEWAAEIPTSCGGGEGCVEVRPIRAKIHPSASAEYVSSVNG